MSLEIRLVQVIGWNLEVLKILANLVNVTGLKKLEKQRGAGIGRTAGYHRVQILFMGCSGFVDREGSELQLQGEVLHCLHCTTEQGVRVKTNSRV